jgi:hypothetical protein
LIFDNYLVIRCYNYPIKYLFNIWILSVRFIQIY